jgi:hypothetical protein
MRITKAAISMALLLTERPGWRGADPDGERLQASEDLGAVSSA